MGHAINPGYNRRDFIKVASAAGGALSLSISLPWLAKRADAALPGGSAWINVWVNIAPDDIVTIRIPTSEMGQGILGALPQIFAEELMVEWANVRAEHAPNRDPAGKATSLTGTEYGGRLTGGSGSVRNRFTLLRRAGAAARDLLHSAAAIEWGIDKSACHAEVGKIVKNDGSAFFRYGELAGAAALLTPSTDNAFLDSILVPADQRRLIGFAHPRPEIPSKVDGSAIFGLDFRVPDMLFAAVVHCPSIVGSLASTPALPKGAIAVVPLTNYPRGASDVNPQGVVNAFAVVAKDTWTAMRAAKNAKPRWTIPATSAAINSAQITADANALMATGTPQGNIPAADNNAAAPGAVAGSVRQYSRTFELPYLAHMCFEPLNCTVRITPGTLCEIWAPTQSVSACATVAASAQMGLGLGATNDHSKIRVTNLLMGGGLGRKFESDFIAQAVQVAKHPAVIGKAVQTVWSREEDTGNDQYRPMTLGRIDAGVDADGKIVGWVSRNVSPSITVQRNTLATNDGQAIESLIRLPYDLGPRKVEWVRHTARPDVGFWRSVGAGMNVFIVESAIDEIALAEGKDPYLYRRSMLEHAEGARWLRVLDTAATMAGWGTRALPATRKLGIAIGEAFATIVCHVVEVSVTAPNSVNVHNVWSAADCGTVVNPDTCKAQIEGAMVYGLSAGLWGKITWKNGGTVEKNYNKSRKLKMAEMPTVEVTMLETPGVALGGLGEPGTPPIAPAVANAYAALTGVRIRTLPMFPAQSVMLDL